MAVTKRRFKEEEARLDEADLAIVNKLERAIDAYILSCARSDCPDAIEDFTNSDLGIDDIEIPTRVFWELKSRYEAVGWREFSMMIGDDDQIHWYVLG